MRARGHIRGPSLDKLPAAPLTHIVDTDPVISLPPPRPVAPPPSKIANVAERPISPSIIERELSAGSGAVPLTHASTLPLASVLLIEVTAASPSFISPWRYRDQHGTAGSGFIVDDRRILTNAHVVRDAVRIRVQKFGSAEKYPARTVFMSLECDLALIEIHDKGRSEVSERFWKDLRPLRLAPGTDGVPELYETVSVIGFPSGGQTICVTKGVVSRIDTQVYNKHSSAALLIVQIDAAINPGNSGGPAVDKDGNVAGVAFLKRTLSDSDNVGYIIPARVVDNFLNNPGTNGGQFRGLPDLGFQYQSLDNSSLRRATGLKDTQTGVLVVDVEPFGAMGSLRFETENEEEGSATVDPLLYVGDVILRAEKQFVANDGTVIFRRNERLPFEYLITSKPVGGTTAFTVLRKGIEVGIVAEMRPLPSPAPRSVSTPEYFIIGGLVFTTLSGPLVEEYVNTVGSIPFRIPESVIKSGFGAIKKRSSQIVLLLRILAHEINYGYGSRNCLVLATLNGTEISSLESLVRTVSSTMEPFLSFSFNDTKRKIVLGTVEAREAEEEVLELHGIPRTCSKSLVSRMEAEKK